MDHCTLGFPVHHQLPKVAQTHVRQVGDAIQPSYPLSPPTPSAFDLSQHEGLFQWISSSYQVSRLVIAFFPRSMCLFCFVATVTVCCDFGAQENTVCHCVIFCSHFAYDCCVCFWEIDILIVFLFSLGIRGSVNKLWSVPSFKERVFLLCQLWVGYVFFKEFLYST